MNNSVYNLQTRLFDGYNSMIRPVKDQKTTTVIEMDFSLMQVISMVCYSEINIAYKKIFNRMLFRVIHKKH